VVQQTGEPWSFIARADRQRFAASADNGSRSPDVSAARHRCPADIDDRQRFATTGCQKRFSVNGDRRRSGANSDGQRFAATGRQKDFSVNGDRRRSGANSDGQRFAATGRQKSFSANGDRRRFGANSDGQRFGTIGGRHLATAWQ
jgi:hypothetical protein